MLVTVAVVSDRSRLTLLPVVHSSNIHQVYVISAPSLRLLRRRASAANFVRLTQTIAWPTCALCDGEEVQVLHGAMRSNGYETNIPCISWSSSWP